MKEMETYRTQNLNIAAYIYASGLKFIGTTREGSSYIFAFTPKEKAQRLVSRYFTGTASINPRELFARLNDLKDLIFSGDKNR